LEIALDGIQHCVGVIRGTITLKPGVKIFSAVHYFDNIYRHHRGCMVEFISFALHFPLPGAVVSLGLEVRVGTAVGPHGFSRLVLST
jgi:hypothetical protein